MTTVTLEVGSVVSRYLLTLVGTGSTVTALSDGSDSTYLEMQADNAGTCVVGMSALTAPSGESMIRWRIGVRHAKTSGADGPRNFTVDYASSTYNQSLAFTGATSITTTYSSWVTISGAGANTFVDTATLTIKAPYPGPSSINDARSNIYKMFVEIEYNERPVGSFVAPSGIITDTSKPLIEIGYTDTESDPMSAYLALILDATNTIVLWNSGLITDGSTSIRCGVALSNAEYSLIGVVYQTLGNLASDLFADTFEIDVPLADPPTITAMSVNTSAFNISMLITGATHALHTPATATLERSDDGGTTWSILRDDIVLDGSLEAAYVDYTAPIDVSVKYRAIVLYSLDSDPEQTILSEYSAVTSAVSLDPLDVVWFIRDAHTTPAVTPFEVDVKAPNPWTMTSDEEMAAFSALGRKYPVVVADTGTRGWSWSNIVLEFTDETVYDTFMAMRNAQHAFELYNVPTGRSYIMRIRGAIKVTETNTEPIIWQVAFDAVEIERPRV